MIKRRKLLIAGAGALVMPFASYAQQGKVWRVGYLTSFRSEKDQRFDAFKLQLRDLGYVEGKTVTIDYLSAEGQYDQLPVLASELVRRNVDVIMSAGGTPAAIAAWKAARSIPVVFVNVADPVGQRLVISLARPGGNVTGISNQQSETAIKSLSLLKEIVPSVKRIAILSNPANSSVAEIVAEITKAAKSMRVDIAIVNARAPADFEKAFIRIAQDRAASLVVLGDPIFTSEAGRLADLAAKHRLPAIAANDAFPERGGLMSYGANRMDLVRRGAMLVDNILKGAKPADLPVEQPTKFELVINKKTANALGLIIPQSLLISADKVIE